MSKNFDKGIKDLNSIRLTDAEKTRMLARIFALPIKSPYVKRSPVFAFVESYHVRISQIGALILIFFITGVTYTSGNSLPGDLFYPIKVEVVEPMIGVVNYSPEDKVVWEGEKVERRIVEAEKLAEKNELDDEKLSNLEKRIEKSSTAFARAAQVVASSSSNSLESRKEKEESIKSAFKKKIARESEEDESLEISTARSASGSDPTLEAPTTMMFSAEMADSSITSTSSISTTSKKTTVKKENQKYKIKQLRDTAVRFVDKEDEDEEKSRNNNSEGED